MAILTVGIDLAKNVFAVHGVNDLGKAELVRPSVPRAKLHALVAALPPCLIGMEACSGAHYWARLFARHGHSSRKEGANAMAVGRDPEWSCRIEALVFPDKRLPCSRAHRRACMGA